MPVNSPSYRSRLQRTQSALGAAGFDALFLPASSDLEYLTGEPRPRVMPALPSWPLEWVAGAWLFPDAAPVLTIPKMASAYKWVNPQAWTTMIVDDSVTPEEAVREIVRELELEGKRIAVGPNVVARFAIEFGAVAPTLELIPDERALASVRAQKDEVELDVLRRACEITDSVFSELVAEIKPGVTERQLAAKLEHRIAEHGARPAGPLGVWGWGPTYARSTWDRQYRDVPIEAPNAIAFDFGVFWHGYCTDFCRVVHLAAPSATVRDMYATLVHVQDRVIAELKPDGRTGEDIYRFGMGLLREAGLDRYFPDPLGHGIGMDVHELPSLFTGGHAPIQAGAVVCVEPQIYHGDIYLGIEDVVVIGAYGGQRLTGFGSDLIVVA